MLMTDLADLRDNGSEHGEPVVEPLPPSPLSHQVLGGLALQLLGPNIISVALTNTLPLLISTAAFATVLHQLLHDLHFAAFVAVAAAAADSAEEWI